MTRTSISACRDARGAQWQLGPLPPTHGRLTLIGWSQHAETRDGGVPEEVARVLARALTSIARVTFPSSLTKPVATDGWSPLGDDLVRLVAGSGIGERFVATLSGTPSGIALLSTRRPETAMRLFDDEGFPWWLQGQIVLLSKPDAAPPDVGEEALLGLFEDDWTDGAGSLTQVGIEGFVRPGVDGDVAGLLTLTDAFEEVVLAALERETRDAGFEWAPLSESAFPLP